MLASVLATNVAVFKVVALMVARFEMLVTFRVAAEKNTAFIMAALARVYTLRVAT